MTEAELIVALLAQPAGYEIGVEGQLMVSRMRDGAYALHANGTLVATYAGPGEAVEAFLVARKAMWIGWDLDPPA